MVSLMCSKVITLAYADVHNTFGVDGCDIVSGGMVVVAR